jgi:hypothetical protein
MPLDEKPFDDAWLIMLLLYIAGISLPLEQVIYHCHLVLQYYLCYMKMTFWWHWKEHQIELTWTDWMFATSPRHKETRKKE